jgi:uncharacterized protein (TIGR03790 family)
VKLNRTAGRIFLVEAGNGDEDEVRMYVPATRPFLAVVLAGVLTLSSSPATAQDGTNVLLVINASSATSGQIGAHYARARLVPALNIVQLHTEPVDEIPRDRYEEEIEQPIGEWLKRHSAQDRILYIVLTKGIPLRISGSGGRRGTMGSVDSELTLLYRRLVGTPSPTAGSVSNPYFRESGSLLEAKPFTHADHDIYLVSRLDGFNQRDAIALIDRGASPTRGGDFLLDASSTTAGRVADGWLQATANKLREAGFRDRVVLELTSGILSGRKNVLGYSSLGSNDPSIHQRRLGFEFVPGALATLFVSTDARTLQEPTDQWQPRITRDPSLFFSGSPQSLSGDLIREGITGVAGHVAEPFLDGAIRPDVLFPAYTAGFNLVESFYLAMPYLSWQTVVFGDPLCAPFRTTQPDVEHITPRIDVQTELPEFFYRRRLEFLASTGVNAAAAQLLLESEARRRRGDEAGANQLLEQATAADPSLNAAHLILATAYEKAGEYDLAIERYRLVLERTPGDPVAANNLAYALAVYKNAPQDALPIAERAYAAAPKEGRIADTLGWIYYLLGNASEAETLLTLAAAIAPNNAEIQLHLAYAHAVLGRGDLALAALNRSTQLDSTFANREDVKKLRAQLGKR